MAHKNCQEGKGGTHIFVISLTSMLCNQPFNQRQCICRQCICRFFLINEPLNKMIAHSLSFFHCQTDKISFKKVFKSLFAYRL